MTMLASPVPLSVVNSNLDKLYTPHLHTSSKIHKKSPKHVILPLQKALPTDFKDMYTPDLLDQVNSVGRPLFTDRALVDWAVNDIRSLLIVCELRPEWNGTLPTIVDRAAGCGYRMILLPLDSSDEQMVDTLVSSDLYKEHNFDYKFLVQTAQYTVHAARMRTNNLGTLTKPEWRNVIENYLLNLGCEAQCRLDYKKACSQIKRQRQRELEQQEECGAAPPHYYASRRSSSNSLLKKALLTASSTSPDAPSYLRKNVSTSASDTKSKKASLSRYEKQTVWVNVQSNLYSRLGLDWEADEL